IHPQDEDPSRSALRILHEALVTARLKLIIFDLPAPSQSPFPQTLAKAMPLKAAANIQLEPGQAILFIVSAVNKHLDMKSDDVSPSLWFYALAIFIVLSGFAAFAGLLYSGISDSVSGLMQIIAPGNAELNLSESGEWTIFYENNSYFDGKVYSTGEEISGLEIRVREKATGIDQAVYPANLSHSYSLGSRSGRSILAFQAARAGVYQFNSSYPDSAGPEIMLAVGKGMAEGLFSSIALSMALLFGSILLASIVAYYTYSRRKRALLKREEEERLMGGDS
ncbi:MAG TPA: hypothetical protein PK602_01910, partial [Methanothrix sp.]|nr:hypothetical protein [Methanothrix sp.]